MTSRQRKWQLERASEGRCQTCARKAPPGRSRCLRCAKAHRERQSEKRKIFALVKTQVTAVKTRKRTKSGRRVA